MLIAKRTDTELEEEIDISVLTDNDNNLIVYNDDVNTFDYVIESLIKVCDHEREQAEQCTYIIHYNGKCSVKVGSLKSLKPMCQALLDRGISATIE